APADAEQRHAGDQARVDLRRRRPVKPLGGDRPRAVLDQAEQRRVDRDRADHDERERWIPRAADVEEAGDLGRDRHPAEDQAEGEQRAGHGGDGELDHAWAPTSATVIAAVIMKVATAAIDRGDSRARPHTPWPLVQPSPMVVPMPTSSPATASTGRPRTPAPNAAGAIAAATTPVAISPTRKPTRNRRAESSARPRMPLMPAIRPWNARTRAEARPISAPPARPRTTTARVTGGTLSLGEQLVDHTELLLADLARTRA